MYKRLPLTLLMLLVLSASGCVDIAIDTKIAENGSGSQNWRFTGTALLASEIKKQVENNRFFGKSITREQYKEGDYILENTLNFKDVSELRNADRDVRFVSNGWLVKTHTYTEIWKRSGEAVGLLAQHARGLVPVTLKISVELPGSIIESNADSKEGGIARWTIPVSDLAATKMLVAKSRSWNWTMLGVFAALLLGALAVLGYFVYSTIQKPHPSVSTTVVCGACGANVPGGSAFCNFCGNQMNRD